MSYIYMYKHKLRYLNKLHLVKPDTNEAYISDLGTSSAIEVIHKAYNQCDIHT
jgi:hypothetical protein